MDYELAKTELEATEQRVSSELARLGVTLGESDAGIDEHGHAWVIQDLKGKPVACAVPKKGQEG